MKKQTKNGPIEAGKKKDSPVKKSFSLKGGWKNKKPVLIFIGVFAALIILFYMAWISSFGTNHIFEPIVAFYAAASGKMLTWLGFKVSVSGTMLYSSMLTLNIKRGCDAIEATALFVSAVLAFPVAFRKKIPALIIGVFTLVAVNFIRIITLFITGVKHPSLFNFMHDQIWQIIYIAIAVLMLFIWLQSVRRKEK